MNPTLHDQYLDKWLDHKSCAENMQPLIGRLYREKGIVITVYGTSLVLDNAIDILNAHAKASKIIDTELSVDQTFPVLDAVSKLDLAPARIDIGKLAVRYASLERAVTTDEFVAKELSTVAAGSVSRPAPKDVVLYGFGRIGRLLARLLVEKKGDTDALRLKGFVVRKGAADDLIKRSSLFQRDSVHGCFGGTLSLDNEENAIIANGTMIRMIYSDAPENVDYTQYGINNAILIDNTGKLRDREGLGRHFKAPGVDKVVLTAPGKGDILNVVPGINDELVTPNENILSAASCTTNAIVPVMKAMNDRFGIIHGHMESCHSYTNDQNIIDNYHKSARRGRSGALNMVLTSTGAAKAVAKVLPELSGKLTGNAIRVPTPNVSLAILKLELKKEVTAESINAYLKDVALHSPLHNQIGFTDCPEVVSSDFIGSRYAGVVDSMATIAEGTRCVLYVWYDNEFGYSCQVIRMLRKMTGAELPSLPR